ncbi:MAG TPA: hypothetical protein VFL63_07350 [Rhodanobacteraceae bacterium]|nr:hypothetical protein [Rhodanobacteraceae bacterium]
MKHHSLGRLVVVLSLILLAGCDGSNALRGEPVSQSISPNGRVVALTTRYSGNATVAFVDRVYMKSAADNRIQLILKADKASKIALKWIDDRHLQVDVSCAQIFSYTNFFYLMKDGELVYPVSIDLVNHGLCGT